MMTDTVGPGLVGAGNAAAAPEPLADPGAFYAALRAPGGLFRGKLEQSQVDGTAAVLKSMAGWPLSFAAYGLATPYHETNATMEPVREAYWLSEDWRRAHLRYFPWYGRGLVQLTWEAGYRKADAKLGLGGTLIANPDRAMELPIAAAILRHGMEEGWFSPGHSMAAHLPAVGPADEAHFESARHIINGSDKKALIAAYALKFQAALQAGGWR
jgi:putative chitinase